MYPRVEVEDLGRETVEVVPTSIEVQSNEAEGSLMDRSILTHVNAAHEPHVGVEQKGFCRSVGVRRGPGALDVGDSHKTVEVIDRRGIDSRPKDGEMERRA